MSNVIDLRPIIEERRAEREAKETADFLFQRIPFCDEFNFGEVAKEMLPDWPFQPPMTKPVKRYINCEQEDLGFDIAKEITMIAAEFIHFGNRMNVFAARFLELTEPDDAA